MNAHQIVAKARNLPQVSNTMLKLVELLNDSKDRFTEAAALIQSDGLLTAKLLRVCNSSAFGYTERVASVNHAVLLLGAAEVRRTVLSLCFGNAMTVPLPGYAMEACELWRHSFMAGIAAESIINRGISPFTDASVAFTAGLLHDIGKLAMAQVLTLEAHVAIRNHIAGEGLGSVEAEREVVGTDHAEVGACLLHIWRLPEQIVEAVANHHRPALPQLSSVVHLANRFAHLADAQAHRAAYAFRSEEQIVQAFELDATEQEKLVSLVQSTEDRARELQAVV